LSALAFEHNQPLDVDAIGALFESEHDQHLAWPAAAWPFDPAQWFAALDPALSHRSYFVTDNGARVGHIALRTAPPDSPADCLVSYVYLRASHRGQGNARALLAFIEEIAVRDFDAHALGLVVRTYNPIALRSYERAGFTETARQDTLITMHKIL